MNNLTTRKIVLGLLMVLVLAFSVQGTADALTFKAGSANSGQGDLVTVSPHQEFTIKFSSNVKDRVRAVDEDGDSISLADDNNYYSYDSDEDGDGDTNDSGYFRITSLENRGKGSEEEEDPEGLESVYDYDNEAVTIDSTINLRSGDTIVTSLKEGHSESDQQLKNSITLTGSHDTAGKYTITITDDTDDDDFPGGTAPSPPASITFTIFVAGRNPSAAVAEWGFHRFNLW